MIDSPFKIIALGAVLYYTQCDISSRSFSARLNAMDTAPEKPQGLRERKRQQTLERIAETGLKLFIKNGYEATTLDAIAVAAGISRRTFFYYFKSKEDVLLAWQGGGYKQALRPTMLAESRDQTPLDAARKCLLKLVLRYETKESVVVDRLLRSTEALRLCKEAVYVEMEQTLAEAMCEMWPKAGRRDELRLIAMMAIGALRLALDNWRQSNAERPLAHYLRRSFALLKDQF
jgi:AcrR family transcriptional regulator